MRFRAVTLVLALMIPTQCGAPPGKDAGGDNNPRTGACTIEYQETTSNGVYHVYPEWTVDDLISGKVIYQCGIPPETHMARAALESRRLGAGERWRQHYEQSTSRIPRPKEALYMPGHCDWGTTWIWRVHTWVKGSSRDGRGNPTHFDVEDFSRERRIICPKRG